MVVMTQLRDLQWNKIENGWSVKTDRQLAVNVYDDNSVVVHLHGNSQKADLPDGRLRKELNLQYGTVQTEDLLQDAMHSFSWIWDSTSIQTPRNGKCLL